jgi:hypothetical protein
MGHVQHPIAQMLADAYPADDGTKRAYDDAPRPRTRATAGRPYGQSRKNWWTLCRMSSTTRWSALAGGVTNGQMMYNRHSG